MSKVIKVFLYRGFIPIPISKLKLGTTLDFDCYVQRFNGFVIVIEAGTLLDIKLHQKLISNNFPIYIQIKEYQQYKNYNITHNEPTLLSSGASENLNLEEQIKQALQIKKHLLEATKTHEKLKIIYTLTKNIMHAWLELDVKKSIPLESLNFLVEILISVLVKEKITFSTFNLFLDSEDFLAAHSVKVAFFAALIGHVIGLDLEDLRKLTMAALLHDVGKSEVDEDLFTKPDLLTQSEYQMIQKHAEASVVLVRRSGLKDRHIIAGIQDHHERLDGSGYPSGLKENRISTFGKIIAVCDVFDSLITVKKYRGAYTTFNALLLMRNENKQKLDMSYINILIKLLT